MFQIFIEALKKQIRIDMISLALFSTFGMAESSEGNEIFTNKLMFLD